MRQGLNRACAAALVMLTVTTGIAHSAPPDSKTKQMLELFGNVLDQVDRSYVNAPDNTVLIEGAMKGMLASLDPHSSYLPPEEFARLSRPGPTGSVGLSFVEGIEGLHVVSVVDGSPAAKGGMRDGDVVISVDGRSLRGLGLDEQVAALRGAPGTTAVLSIERDRDPPADVRLVREALAAATIQSELKGDVGYVHVQALSEDSGAKTRTAVAALRAKSPQMKGLVLDLRGCPGGLLDQSVAIAGLFLHGGTVVVQHGRDPKDVERYDARDGDVTHGLPLVVLINGETASGCEIIAAALQDWKRAQVVGLPSFGEGSVQTVIPLRGGADGALKITTALFDRPSGAPIQRVGVIPDVLVAPSQSVADALTHGKGVFSERDMPRALDVPGAPSDIAPAVKAEAPPATFDPKGDYQLARSLELLASAQVKPGP